MARATWIENLEEHCFQVYTDDNIFTIYPVYGEEGKLVAWEAWIDTLDTSNTDITDYKVGNFSTLDEVRNAIRSLESED